MINHARREGQALVLELLDPLLNLGVGGDLAHSLAELGVKLGPNLTRLVVDLGDLIVADVVDEIEAARLVG